MYISFCMFFFFWPLSLGPVAYDKATNQLQSSIRRHQHIIQHIPGCQNQPPISFKRSRNLKDLLIQCEFKEKHRSPPQNLFHSNNMPVGHHPYGHCCYCKYTSKITEFVSPFDQKKTFFKTIHHLQQSICYICHSVPMPQNSCRENYQTPEKMHR